MANYRTQSLGDFRLVLSVDVYSIRSSVEPSRHLAPVRRLSATFRQNGYRLVDCSPLRHLLVNLIELDLLGQYLLARGTSGVLVLAARVLFYFEEPAHPGSFSRTTCL